MAIRHPDGEQAFVPLAKQNEMDEQVTIAKLGRALREVKASRARSEATRVKIEDLKRKTRLILAQIEEGLRHVA